MFVYHILYAWTPIFPKMDFVTTNSEKEQARASISNLRDDCKACWYLIEPRRGLCKEWICDFPKFSHRNNAKRYCLCTERRHSVSITMKLLSTFKVPKIASRNCFACAVRTLGKSVEKYLLARNLIFDALIQWSHSTKVNELILVGATATQWYGCLDDLMIFPQTTNANCMYGELN